MASSLISITFLSRAFPFVVSSFKDPPCSAVIDTPVQPSVGGRLRKCIIFGVPEKFPSLS